MKPKTKTKAPKRKPKSQVSRLSDAYKNRTGVRFSAAQVQALVLSDNALQSLIEEWSQ